MGYITQASGPYSTAIGQSTVASGDSSTAMGKSTAAIGNISTAMGFTTTASGFSSTAIGYFANASGDYGAVAMGNHADASGKFSIAMGSNVGTNGHKGSFIYGDASRSTGIVNSADNQFMAIADGGFVMVSKADGSTGAELKPGNSSWTTLSDRNAKTAVQPVDGREVLKKVTALPLNTWQYKAQDAKYRHMGPMAQDFYAAFQLGESDKGIDTVDADGVALAAIQGLHAELTDKDRQIAALREEKDREIAALHAETAAQANDNATLRSDMATQAKRKDAEIAALCAELSAQKTETARQKKRVAALESLAGDVASLKAQLAARRQPSSSQTEVALVQP